MYELHMNYQTHRQLIPDTRGRLLAQVQRDTEFCGRYARYHECYPLEGLAKHPDFPGEYSALIHFRCTEKGAAIDSSVFLFPGQWAFLSEDAWYDDRLLCYEFEHTGSANAVKPTGRTYRPRDYIRRYLAESEVPRPPEPDEEPDGEPVPVKAPARILTLPGLVPPPV